MQPVNVHPVNKILGFLGLRLSRTTGKMSKEFKREYDYYLKQAKKNDKGFRVFKQNLYYNAGTHPVSFRDFECAYAAYHLSKKEPAKILDIGSYRHFILGLLAHFEVTTVDVRERETVSDKETIITCDAKNLNLPSNSFDAVVSLCALEHFGLGRYGDEFDLDADT